MEIAEIVAPTCPLDGQPGEFLGVLGNLAHFRCRGCGMDFSVDSEAVAIADGTDADADDLFGMDIDEILDVFM